MSSLNELWATEAKILDTEASNDNPFSITDINEIKNIIIRPLPSLAEKIDFIVDRGFRVCRWGSCQYSSAQDMFDLLQHLGKSGMKVREICDLINVPYFIDDIPFNELDDVKKILLEQRMDNSRVKPEETRDYCREYRERVLGAIDTAELFVALRKSSFDLWTASKLIFDATWPTHTALNMPRANGRGPVINCLVQGDNLEVGMMCWMLVVYGLVPNDKCYREFDT